MRNEKSAGIVIYYMDKEPKFLLLKYTTYWGFAKGMIEENETEEQAARREVREETNLEDVKIIPGFKFEQNWMFKLNNETVKKHAVFFLGKIEREKSGNVKISHEHEDFAWVNYQDALKKMKIKNNKDMITQARDFILENEKQKKLI